MGKRRDRSTRLTNAETLQRFLEEVHGLRELRLVESGMSFYVEVTYDPVAGFSHKSGAVDEDDLRSFLLSFRKLVMQGSPIRIGSVLNAAHNCVTDIAIVNQVDAIRDKWMAEMSKSRVGHMLPGQRALTAERALDLWLNGHYFHDDEEKKRELETLQNDPSALAREQFLFPLLLLTRLILDLGDLLRQALDKHVVAM